MNFTNNVLNIEYPRVVQLEHIELPPVEDFTTVVEERVPPQQEAPPPVTPPEEPFVQPEEHPFVPPEEQPFIPPKDPSPEPREEEIESLQELVDVEESVNMRRSKGPVEAGGPSRMLSELKLRVLNPDDVRYVSRGQQCFLRVVIEPEVESSSYPLSAIIAGWLIFAYGLCK